MTASRTFWFLAACSAALIALWLPILGYPVVSDTVHYAFLGRSLWEHGAYALHGEPYANQLPLHALLSYPFTRLLGLHAGMHVLSLLGGIATLWIGFFLARRSFSAGVAVIAALALLTHPGFVLMSMLGSADLTYTALFLGAVLACEKAADDRRWYLACGALAGFACLARYNGAPLFLLLPVYVAWRRRPDLRSTWFWSGMILGGAIFGLWFLRNFLVFGDPFYSGYVFELQARQGPLQQILRNLRYYGNPIHNVFPFLFPFALYGLWVARRNQQLLILAMIAGWLLAAIWWVQAIRFAFAGFAILLIFAARGLAEGWKKSPRILGVAVLVVGIGVQSLSLCVYAYGACNAAFDATIGQRIGMPRKNMGLSPEGFYAEKQAREFINAHAPPGATVASPSELELGPFFRPDIRFLDDAEVVPCGSLRITQRAAGERQTVLFRTTDEPVMFVLREECPKSV